MRLRRFLVDDLSPPLVHLTGRESRHAIQVLRLKVGDSVVLFDGRGLEATGIVREVGRLTMAVEISERRAAPPRTLVSLTLAVATPKGERADWLVEKCAELGVTALWLLETERSQVRPGEGKLERWRRKALQAAKQAGHASIMTVEAHRPLDEVLTSRDRFRILYGEPRASVSLLEALHDLSAPETQATAELLVLIGPEGGFTDDETTRIDTAGGTPFRLSDSILRVETAAVATAAVWAVLLTAGPHQRPM